MTNSSLLPAQALTLRFGWMRKAMRKDAKRMRKGDAALFGPQFATRIAVAGLLRKELRPLFSPQGDCANPILGAKQVKKGVRTEWRLFFPNQQPPAEPVV